MAKAVKVNNGKKIESNTKTIRAIEQVKKGKTTKHKNVNELISFLNK